MDKFFETERLICRAINQGDLNPFAALCADPIAMQHMGDGEVLDRETVQRWIDICQDKYAQRGYGTSAIIEKESQKFIGFCGVIRAPEHDFDEIIYALAQDYWDKGYATEISKAMLDYVFGISQLDKIYATIDERNESSLKMMAKLGMSYEKTITDEDGFVVKYYVIERPTK